MRGLALVLAALVGCQGPIPVYVEDQPELVATTTQAVEDLERWLGPTFEVRPGRTPRLKVLANPRGGIAVISGSLPSGRDGRTAPIGHQGFIRVNGGATPATVAHEIVHALGLIAHHDGPENLMHHESPEQWELTDDQVEDLHRRAALR